MQHKDWLAWRREGLGSSDAATIMGVSPWKTKLQLYKEKAFGIEEDKDTPWMKRGRDTEPLVRTWLEEHEEILLSPENIEHTTHNWLRCSVDAMDIYKERLYEIKCPGIKDHEIAMEGKIPEKYYPQLQHQLMVTELPSMKYVSFYDNDYQIIVVDRDENYIEDLLDQEKIFWEYVLKTRSIIVEVVKTKLV